MKKKESLVTVSQFKRGLRDLGARLEGKLGGRIGGVEKRLDAKIDSVEKKLNSRIDGVEKRLNLKFVKVDDKIDLLEVKIEDKAQQRHNQILNLLDEIMVEVKASREEREWPFPPEFRITKRGC